MTRTAAALLVAFLLVPTATSAQVELGIDGGLTVDIPDIDGADNLNTISFPASWLRVGFGAMEMISVETMLAFQRLSEGDASASSILLMPGVNVALGESGFYVRGEVGLQRASFDFDGNGDSQTQFGLGAAAGLKKAIADGPIAFRLEGGLAKWLEKEEDGVPGYTSIRILMGISATVN